MPGCTDRRNENQHDALMRSENVNLTDLWNDIS